MAPQGTTLPVPSASFSSAILVRSPSPGRCPSQTLRDTRAGPGGRSPSTHGGPPDPPNPNRGPRSLGPGESFIHKAPEPPWPDWDCQGRCVALFVYSSIYLINYFIWLCCCCSRQVRPRTRCRPGSPCALPGSLPEKPPPTPTPPGPGLVALWRPPLQSGATVQMERKRTWAGCRRKPSLSPRSLGERTRRKTCTK